MPLYHIVALKFKAELSDERIIEHFEKEVNLKERMPDLVQEWHFSKNVSLADRLAINKGCNWVIMVKFADKAALDKYQPHPKHVEVKGLQAPLIDDIFVCDMEF